MSQELREESGSQQARTQSLTPTLPSSAPVASVSPSVQWVGEGVGIRLIAEPVLLMVTDESPGLGGLAGVFAVLSG